MDTAISWIAAHWSDLLAAWGALVAFASVVVKLSPSTTDDAILAKVVKVADWFSVVYPKKG
jgi:hypothetical protein